MTLAGVGKPEHRESARQLTACAWFAGRLLACLWSQVAAAGPSCCTVKIFALTAEKKNQKKDWEAPRIEKTNGETETRTAMIQTLSAHL